MQTTALWHIDSSNSELQTVTLPSPKKEEIIIKSLYSLVSTGTERLVSSGGVPTSLHQSMKVQGMAGTFNFPVKYGYSVVGKVVSNGELAGKLVHLMYPHQNQIIVSPTLVSEIPTAVTPKIASLASNMETALNAIWDSGVSVGDRVMICGFGMIGALVARLLSFLPAVEVFILEKNPNRLAVAKKMGFQTVEVSSNNCLLYTSPSPRD